MSYQVLEFKFFNITKRKFVLNFTNRSGNIILITAKRKASGFKNEKRFSTQKTKCDLKKHFKAQKKAFDFSSDAFFMSYIQIEFDILIALQ